MLYYSHFVVASSLTTFRFLADLQLLYLDAVDNFLNYGSLDHRSGDHGLADLALLDPEPVDPDPLDLKPLNLEPLHLEPLDRGRSMIGRRLCPLLSIKTIPSLPPCLRCRSRVWLCSKVESPIRLAV